VQVLLFPDGMIKTSVLSLQSVHVPHVTGHLSITILLVQRFGRFIAFSQVFILPLSKVNSPMKSAQVSGLLARVGAAVSEMGARVGHTSVPDESHESQETGQWSDSASDLQRFGLFAAL